MKLRSICISLVILLAIAGITDAKTIVVDDDGIVGIDNVDYNETWGLQFAATDAADGDTIQVRSGHYIPAAFYNKRLTLQGIATDGTKPIIDGAGSLSLSITGSDGSIVEGFAIVNGGTIGIEMQSVTNSIIRNNDFINNMENIYLSTSNNNEISNNAMMSGGMVGDGVALRWSNSNTIKDNDIRDQSNGFSISNSNSNIIQDNNIENNRVGISITSQSEYNNVIRNDIHHNEYDGVSIHESLNNIFNDNTISNNSNSGMSIISNSNSNQIMSNTIRDHYRSGISVNTNSNSNQIIGNTLYNNSRGIMLSNSNGHLVRDNTIERNRQTGIYTSNVDNSDIFNNIFDNADNHMIYTTTNTRWNTTETVGTNIVGGPKIAGNYWADPYGNDFSETCYDRGDGICYTSYELATTHTDYLPLTLHSEPIPVEAGEISLEGDSVMSAGGSVTISSTITGSGDATITYGWDDGTTDTDTIHLSTQTVTRSHQYTTPGVYTLTLTVENNGQTDTATYEYIVVYDPNGGFVTGGGKINSPLGAYSPDPSLTGHASFGFVSKYKKGAEAPIGNTEFQFRAGSFNFRSTSYQWLVVAGNKAQYKGIGSINGEDGYKFLLTAYDGRNVGTDKFRIKIWQEVDNIENIIYDNVQDASDDIDSANPQDILEGSIIVHKE